MIETQAIRAVLQPLADAQKAAQMAAYLRNHFAFLGVPQPARKQATRQWVEKAKNWNSTELRTRAEALWAQNEREFQYVALDFLSAGADSLAARDLEWVEALARQKSWWDSTDTLAPKIVGRIVRNFPASAATVEKWGGDADFWLRRVAILHQLGFKNQTDAPRLFRLCLANAPDREFFIRKGIGWALREYAKTNPDAVFEFLRANENQFSPLTLREARRYALKHGERPAPHSPSNRTP